MMNDAQTGNITGHNTIASALTNIVTGKEDANFSSPNGKYNFFTCSSNTLKCDEYAFNASSILIAGNGEFNVKHYTGKFNAYNKGVMRAKGKYIAFLSCDDFIHDITSIYDIVNLMEETDADFTFAPAYCRHPEGFVFLFAPSMHNAFQVMPCARQAMFFKKSMIEKENYFDEKFKTMSDFDFIMRIIMKGYKPAFFDNNYVTYKLGTKALENPERSENESKAIYYKNFRNLYPLNEEMLDRMAKYSEFPKPLLDRLAKFFPEADRDLFFEKCEQMHNIRVQAIEQQKRIKENM